MTHRYFLALALPLATTTVPQFSAAKKQLEEADLIIIATDQD